MTVNVDKTFIVHYKKLTERKITIKNILRNLNITDYEFRDKYQRENLTNEIKDKYFVFNNLSPLNNLSPAQICITIEHIEIFREIVENDYKGWCLILEDDALFCNNFVTKLNELLENVPVDAEYLDISDYFNLHSNEKWVKKTSTRTNVSYLIKKETCKKLLETIIPFEFPIDHELNKQFKIHNTNVYWSGESLVSQGSYHYGSSYIH